MELECKVAVSQNDIDKLLENLGEPIFIEYQENHYLDSPDEVLHKNNSTLRIRISKNSHVSRCTLKEDSQTMHGTCVRWSTHAEIPSQLAQRVLKSPEDLLAFSCAKKNDLQMSEVAEEREIPEDFALTSPRGFENPIASSLREKYGVRALKYVGGFKTLRRHFQHPGSEVQPHGLRLKLDAVELPSSATYYELEVVGLTVPISDILEELCEFLRRINVSYKISETSKYELFQKEKRSSLTSGDIRESHT